MLEKHTKPSITHIDKNSEAKFNELKFEPPDNNALRTHRDNIHAEQRSTHLNRTDIRSAGKRDQPRHLDRDAYCKELRRRDEWQHRISKSIRHFRVKLQSALKIVIN